jgi:hypothetical protein
VKLPLPLVTVDPDAGPPVMFVSGGVVSGAVDVPKAFASAPRVVATV